MSLLIFEERPQKGRKTKLWHVMVPAKTGKNRKKFSYCLGEVKWYGTWRKYVFYPWPYTLFDHICLRDIADFTESETVKHRRSWRK